MKVAIIGAGAAGLMAAATILEQAPGTELFLLERNDGLGKKVIISGGGRCNVTTGFQDVRTVLTKYPRGAKFLQSAMHLFPPAATYEWFESHGVPLKVEEDNRVFPVSDDGKDVVGAFDRLLRGASVRVMLKTAATGVQKVGEQFAVSLKGEERPLLVDRLVLTTGGQAYRHTGSTGDGYAFAQSLGHTLTLLAPSLNSFFTYETWPAEVSGLSFAKARLTADRGKGFSFSGPMLFTHKGVSGPAVFALSSLVAFETYDAKQPLKISIDLFPDESRDDLMSRWQAWGAENPKKSLVNALATFVPKTFAEVACREKGLEQGAKVADTSKKDVARALDWLKAIPLSVIQRGAGDEFVTAGGVNVKEVDPSTMESKVCPGLFFAGEILDVDGFTGGFNLQASWATGHLAGESVANS